MDALTSEFIKQIGVHVHPELTYHEASVAYLQYLLKPYAEALEPAVTVEGIVQWIPLALPSEMAKYAIAELHTAVLEQAGEAAYEEVRNHPNILAAAKVSIIEYVLVEMLEFSGNNAILSNQDMVLPWDIQRGIQEDTELPQMFGVQKDDRLLPVVVTIGPQHFTHMLTEEFTCGLLLFSTQTVGDCNFYITMFGTQFLPDYMIKEKGNHFIGNELSKYSVSIGEKEYTFETVDFMQGFITGALWANVDHHKFWKHLFLFGDERSKIPVNF